MPSSISSSDHDFFSRAVPDIAWRRAFVVALALSILLLAGWEWYWRDFGVTPSYRNSDSLWVMQRKRIDSGDHDGVAIVGSSRAFFDLQLDAWEDVAGKRPVQLSFEGTTALPFLEDIAENTTFDGALIVGVTPALFFGDREGARISALEYYRKETPSQWLGQRISMLIEPWLAFYDPDFALFNVLHRQDWPEREGVPNRKKVRKVVNLDADRNALMWDRFDTDPDYARNQQMIWQQFFPPPMLLKNEKALAKMEAARAEATERAARAVATLRERGAEVILVRLPSEGPFRETERTFMPRDRFWDVLVDETGAMAIHFEDHPELQGFTLPEWSHISGREAAEFTRRLYEVIEMKRKEQNP